MADYAGWNTATLQKLGLPALAEERIDHVAKMDFTGDTNVPDGFVQLSREGDSAELQERGAGGWNKVTLAGMPIIKHKLQDQTQSSNGTVTDTDITFDVVPGRLYKVDGFLRFVIGGSVNSGDYYSTINMTNLSASGAASVSPQENSATSDREGDTPVMGQHSNLNSFQLRIIVDHSGQGTSAIATGIISGYVVPSASITSLTWSKPSTPSYVRLLQNSMLSLTEVG